MILEHNKLYEQGLVSFRMKVNHFADQSVVTVVPIANLELPEALDWRRRGYVTEVKDQDKCGACWSFSATGALEGQHYRRTGRLVSLSEQNLIDCAGGSDGGDGCDGGDMERAYKYVIANGGIDSERDYPFEKKGGPCRYSARAAAATARDFVLLDEGDEEQLLRAVAAAGPVAAGIDSSPASFHFYDEGVYSDEDCSSEHLDHAVLIAGYGRQDGRPYWLVKNSWGAGWGQGGYMRLARGEGNHCGVATYASYPLV
ncbi:procathepsin L-like [Bacillus rossius redtenbacheri]|uniref:procathepsin L-like n=1 Tax=Bacillus rossius redtenbacheri TaxID=93214 RepID=UPI002FDE914F